MHPRNLETPDTVTLLLRLPFVRLACVEEPWLASTISIGLSVQAQCGVEGLFCFLTGYRGLGSESVVCPKKGRGCSAFTSSCQCRKEAPHCSFPEQAQVLLQGAVHLIKPLSISGPTFKVQE